MPDPLFSELYHDTRNLTWEPVEAVRSRGRQRTRRTRVAAGLASVVAVAVLTSGAVALAGRPDATPPPLPPATVVPTTPSPGHTVAPTPSVEPSSTPSRTATSSPPTGGGPASRSPSRAIPAGATLQLADLPPGFTMTRGKGEGDWTLESATIYCDNRLPSLAVGEVANRFVQFDSPTDWLVER
ncbi:hypothetical protein ONA70_25720, partial [Micromonospora yasonensis]|nr:hypothetical protein [Micromonospora yasonensis]